MLTHIRQVFGALQYVNSLGLLHGTVDLQSIRVCGGSGRVMLCEYCNCRGQCAY